jgi:hypothetical protein
MITTLTPRYPRRLPRAWKVAISMGGAIAMAPVIAVIAGLVAVWVLPGLVFVLPLMVLSRPATVRLPTRPVRPALPLRPAIAR